MGRRPGDGALPGLELVLLAADGAAEVADAGVVGENRQPVGRTGAAEAVLGHPALGQVARLLGRAGVDGARLAEAQPAPRVGIRPHPPTVAGGSEGVSPACPLRLGEGLSARERSERLREGVRVGWSGRNRVGQALRCGQCETGTVSPSPFRAADRPAGSRALKPSPAGRGIYPLPRV